MAKRGASALLAAVSAVAVSACSDGPDLERLAPTMPRLQAEVPETRHPQSQQGQYPNINITPDRPSELRSEKEREEVEKSLEQQGQGHVKEAVTTITGQPPEEEDAEVDGEEQRKPPESSSGSSSAPLQLAPSPSDEPS